MSDSDRPARGRPPGPARDFSERRAEIVDVAARTFAQNGYAGTGMSVLVEKSNLSGRGALYHYIGSKQELLVEIAFSVLTPLYENAALIAGLTAENPLTRLRLISETFLHTIAEKPSHVWVYEHDYRFLSDQHRDRFNAMRAQLEGVILGLVSEAIDEGVFVQVEPRLAVFAFFNLHNRTVQWFRQGGRWTAAYLSKTYCEILFNGMRASSAAPVDVEGELDTFRARHAGWPLAAPDVSAAEPVP
ncbi:TetR/AcrR family transcriptional regulator [Sciscionella marina]|uniref:TetR/AcrR family transcriptional regulator n=1 Tax=Sciscionella marina TaxID=508770 RepID=UPI0004769378|nr:TetR/AcrR family transcriptional regulator [Sciscionella marina]